MDLSVQIPLPKVLQFGDVVCLSERTPCQDLYMVLYIAEDPIFSVTLRLGYGKGLTVPVSRGMALVMSINEGLFHMGQVGTARVFAERNWHTHE
jgi:hypothetical protein